MKLNPVFLLLIAGRKRWSTRTVLWVVGGFLVVAAVILFFVFRAQHRRERAEKQFIRDTTALSGAERRAGEKVRDLQRMEEKRKDAVGTQREEWERQKRAFEILDSAVRARRQKDSLASLIPVSAVESQYYFRARPAPVGNTYTEWKYSYPTRNQNQ